MAVFYRCDLCGREQPRGNLESISYNVHGHVGAMYDHVCQDCCKLLGDVITKAETRLRSVKWPPE